MEFGNDMGLVAIKGNNMHGLRKALTLTLLISPCTLAEDYFSMSLEDLMNVSVTGSTLREESLETVPSVVTVFTHQEIKTLGFDYLYELLGHVPGFQVSRNGDSPSGYTVSARARRNSAEAREILLVVDGQVLADPRTGGADGSLPHFPLAQVERVEIIRGPGSAIYGSGAFTGVVNIITRKEIQYLSVGTGSFEKRKLNVGFSHAMGDWLASVSAAADIDHGDKYHQFFGLQEEPTTDPRAIYSFNGNLVKGSTRVTASLFRTNSENFLVAEQVNNEINNYTQDLQHLGVEHSLELDKLWTIKLLAGYTWINQELATQLTPENYFTNVSNPSSSDALIAYGRLAGESFRLMLANDHNLSAENNLQWGMEFQQRKETDATAYSNFNLEQLASGQFPLDYYGNFTNGFPIGRNSSQKATSFYGQWIHSMPNDLRLTLGGRYDKYESFNSRFSPRVGLVKEFPSATQFKILYGEAFRAPSLSETGLLNNPVLVGNPDVESELVKTWDFVLQQQWQSSHLSLTVFHNAYEQPIATGFQSGVRTYINGADQSAQGITPEWIYSLTEGLVLRANATHFVHLPDPAFRESKNLANVMLMWNQSDWGLGMSYQYQGERDTLATADDKITLASSRTLNLHLEYQYQKNLNIEMTFKNLLNETRLSPTQGVGFTSGVPMRGMEWVLGMTWDWH